VTRRTTMLALVAAGAALGLTGCTGQLTPGVAAEVGDDTITMTQTDDFAAGLCAFTAANGQSSPTAEARRSSLNTLIVAQLAHDHADREGVDIDQDVVTETLTSVEGALKELSEPEREDFLEDVRYVVEGDSIIQQTVIEQLQASGQEPTQETAQAAQQELLTEWADEAGVEVDPRFGVWEDNHIEPKSGSISVPTERDTATDSPSFLTCG
jgi:hypothetical protein